MCENPYWADSAYDAEGTKAFSEKPGHVPVIDPNPRWGDKMELAPVRKIRYRERSTVERGNSDLKDNYGARHVRVKGHWKVLCHLMFGVIAILVWRCLRKNLIFYGLFRKKSK